jgi:hypothetical protein
MENSDNFSLERRCPQIFPDKKIYSQSNPGLSEQPVEGIGKHRAHN